MTDRGVYDALSDVMHEQKKQQKILKLICKMVVDGEIPMKDGKKIIKYLDDKPLKN